MKEKCLECGDSTTDNLTVVWKDPNWGVFIFPAEDAWIYEPERIGYFCDTCWKPWAEDLRQAKPYLKLSEAGYKPRMCWKKIDQIVDTVPDRYYAKAELTDSLEIQDRLG